MGIRDRDYYRDRPAGQFTVRSVLAVLIGLNLAVWLFQVLSIHSPIRLEEYLAANPLAIFERYYFWQPLTANFLHAPRQIGHILGNMLFLFLFGRELEVLYGKFRFLTFYLTAGFVAILLQAAYHYYFSGKDADTLIYGASGAVMATVVLFTTHFPRQEFYLIFLVPIPAWILCSVYVMLDLLGALSGTSPGVTQVAFLAHLGGAAFGLLWRVKELHWGPTRLVQAVRSLRRRPRRVKPPRRPSQPQPLRRSTPEIAGESRDPVSLRIDQLLEKISRSGRGSLTAEELEYLQRNSGRYRSEK
jgi:membrane associated rhomboid family serine protease